MMKAGIVKRRGKFFLVITPPRSREIERPIPEINELELELEDARAFQRPVEIEVDSADVNIETIENLKIEISYLEEKFMRLELKMNLILKLLKEIHDKLKLR